MSMDDGLVLNLSTEDSSANRSKAKKGGRWTERAKAKRSAKRKTPHADEPVSKDNGGAVHDIDDARPAKRARTEVPASTSFSSFPVQSKESGSLKQTGNVVSSLFSFNPRVEVPSVESSKINLQPSNAPLENSSTFIGLGVDPLISYHLTTKMSIENPTSIQRAALPVLLSNPLEGSPGRDVFIQSQTGSGKTLSFLLPVIQDLLPLSTHSYIDRSIGTLAIIIAPTRELAKQISDVLEALLQLRLRPQTDDDEHNNPSTSSLTRWLVSGLLVGGGTRSHEKARLRKGLPILVATPGRLLDHLQNTSSLDVGKCRWLVLDEADRLMDLGFEDTLRDIIKALDGRRRLAKQAVEEGKSMDVGGWDWERRRQTILCSATIREDVQKLAGEALVQPLVIKALTEGNISKLSTNGGPSQTSKYTPPSQLLQKHVVVPLKLRLVALIALLRSLLSKAPSGQGLKIIVFLSCTDAVDFYWRLLGGSVMASTSAPASEDSSEWDSDSDDEEGERSDSNAIGLASPLLPQTSIFRLHGSLPTPTRLASLRAFSGSSQPDNNANTSSSILLCTSVASRGLDLPLVRVVIQYDLPTEGGATEYVHRVGRTARVGKGGQAWSFVSPNEVDWVKWVETEMRDETIDVKGKTTVSLQGVGVEEILRSGYGGVGTDYEDRATNVQLAFERWVLRSKEHTELARKAFRSHVRAYATHPSNEKHIFHIKRLHLGHLAKSFGLREAPGTMAMSVKKTRSPRKPRNVETASKTQATGKDWREVHDEDAERRMEKVVRAQGKLTKKKGVLMSTGTDEFHVASGAALEKLVRQR